MNRFLRARNAFRMTIGVPAVAAGLLVCASAGASVITIDNFSAVDAAQWPVLINSVGSATVNESGLSGVIGGSRQTTVSLASVGVPDLDFIHTSISPGAGLLSYTSSVGATGNVSLLYDGGGTGLGADFSDQIGIDIIFTMFDHASAMPLPVTVTIDDGINAASLTLALNAPGGQNLFFDFASFMGTLPNLEAIHNIQIDFDPSSGADFRVGHIVTVIPSPGALALLGIAGLAARRRRRA